LYISFNGVPEAEIRLEEFESRLEDYQLNEVLKSKGIGIKT